MKVCLGDGHESAGLLYQESVDLVLDHCGEQRTIKEPAFWLDSTQSTSAEQ